MFEYSSSVEPAVMVVRGVLHGCIGVCCSAKYPSVFANIGDKEIWDFVQEKAIKIDVDHMGKNQNQDGNDEEGKNINQIVDHTRIYSGSHREKTKKLSSFNEKETHISNL